MRVLGVIVAVLLACAAAASEDEGDDNEWLDPTDMLRYNTVSKTMQKLKSTDATHSAHSVVECSDGVTGNKQAKTSPSEDEQQSKKQSPPLTHPVLKRYFTRLLKSVRELGLPNETSDVHYDVEIKLSEQSVTEIQKFLDGDGQVNQGVLDEIVGQLLLNMKHHDREASKWRFEDTFGVDLSTAVGVCFCVFLITVTICIELWSKVSWSRQFKRLFVISFLCSILWNWYYLYKAEFASHMAKILQMKNISQKCLGLEEFDWYDNVCAFFRRTFTMQRDPCEEYLRAIVISPLWLVPPNRAISVTFVAFVTDPLERFGEGLNRLIRASLQDLPVLLHLPVLILVILLPLFLVYKSKLTWIQRALSKRLGRATERVVPLPANEH